MAHNGDDEDPWYPEETLLEDEIGGGSLRIAVSFAFLSEGKTIELDEEIIRHNIYEDIELVAAVGNGLNRQGMFAQAVWFGEGGASWKWMRINGIKFIACPDDSMFRAGTERCVAVCTSTVLYYLTIPHPDYRTAWSRTLKAIWPTKKVDVKVWPLRGYRPTWWFEEYKDDWPFDKVDEKDFSEKEVLSLRDVLANAPAYTWPDL
ncbi:hypothetical protein RSOL_320120 [Rhizoctonia solani AG-3 Rhs1AP]|uniref:Uncharacterized protein n=2 Tax=Rhizoctonia solani AG-3 TaxID=1086053 RepID=A0A074RZL1_9AGAM|nr:hypothetical protein RSOL_320120 [Rhizoctonia solani AG-3 Rhs1AP]KEP50098.1 hypothetical protein V565_086550 [Rhizoctonia solani 123E]